MVNEGSLAVSHEGVIRKATLESIGAEVGIARD